MLEIIVKENEAGQRFDKLLAKRLNKAPMSFFYKMMRKKNITLNGKKATGKEIIQKGDQIKLFLSDETIEKFSEQQEIRAAGKLKVLYEDHNLILINKPVGMLSQKAKESDVSAVEELLAYLINSGQMTREELKTFHPSFCNRLDRNTSGILAGGKTLAGLQELSAFFRERTIEKYYLCPVKGKIEEDAYIKGYLKKDSRTNKVKVYKIETDGSTAIETSYHPLASNNDVTLLEVHLITGKTHQIRAHLASTGHPILGDYKYGDRAINEDLKKKYKIQTQLLHAYRLKMPNTEGVFADLAGMEFCAPVPEQFRKVCREKGILPEHI